MFASALTTAEETSHERSRRYRLSQFGLLTAMLVSGWPEKLKSFRFVDQAVELGGCEEPIGGVIRAGRRLSGMADNCRRKVAAGD
jgi:hypothetical protein